MWRRSATTLMKVSASMPAMKKKKWRGCMPATQRPTNAALLDVYLLKVCVTRTGSSAVQLLPPPTKP